MFSSFMVLGIHRSVLRRHIKEVVLIAHGAVLHHSLLVIYWSKYLRASLSNDISALICLSFYPAALYLFGSGADPAARLWRRSALTLHLKRLYRTPSTPNIHLPAETRSRCDVVWLCLHVYVRQNMQVIVSTPRQKPFSLRAVGSEPGIVVSTVQIWILLTSPSGAGVSNTASCVHWNSQPSLSNCWDGATPKPKLITLNEQKLQTDNQTEQFFSQSAPLSIHFHFIPFFLPPILFYFSSSRCLLAQLPFPWHSLLIYDFNGLLSCKLAEVSRGSY